MTDTSFPSTAWEFSIDQSNPVEIVHPSGLKFISVIKVNRLDRLEGKESHQYPLREKDSFLISYLIDYFLTKSENLKLDTNQSMVLSANLFCAYRFRTPLKKELFCNDSIDCRDFRKFGEHWIFEKNNPTKKIPVFVIGKGEDKSLFAVNLGATSSLNQYELMELPRNYYYRKP